MGQLNICKFPHRKIAAQCKKTCPKLGIFDPPMKYWNVTRGKTDPGCCVFGSSSNLLKELEKLKTSWGGRVENSWPPNAKQSKWNSYHNVTHPPRQSPEEKSGILWNNFIKRRLTHGHWKVEQYSAEAESAKAFSHNFSVYLSEKISCSKRCKFFNQMSHRG